MAGTVTHNMTIRLHTGMRYAVGCARTTRNDPFEGMYDELTH